MQINIKQLPFPVDQFHCKLLAYMLARIKHRTTQESPAPFPEHDMLRAVVDAIESNEPFEIVTDLATTPSDVVLTAQAEYSEERFRAMVEAEKQKLRAADNFVIASAPSRTSLLDFIA